MSYLEGVDQLVGQRVLELRIGAGEEQHDAVADPLGDARGAFGDLELEDVRLLEIGLGRVEDQGLPALPIVAEDLRQTRVRPLRHAGGVHHRRLFLRIVVDVEVLGLEHLEVEIVVLDLVLSELSVGGRGDEQSDDDCRGER